MKILSIDPAVATFAYSLLEITHNVGETYSTFLRDNIRILDCDMKNLTDGSKVTDMSVTDKILSLKRYLDTKKHLFVGIDLLIIESQKGYKPNEEFAAIILGAFSQFDIADYLVIDAGEKHKIWFHESCKREHFTHLSSKYLNNKKHIVEHFRWLAKEIGYDQKIHHSAISHIADSVLQAVAYYFGPLSTVIDHSDSLSQIRGLYANK